MKLIRSILTMAIFVLPLTACQSATTHADAKPIPGLDATTTLPGPPGLMENILAVMYDDTRSIAEVSGE
jgi:hypothetical protein